MLRDTLACGSQPWADIGEMEQMPPGLGLSWMETASSYFKGAIETLLSPYLFLSSICCVSDTSEPCTMSRREAYTIPGCL